MGVHSEIIEIDASTRQWKALTSGDHSIPPTWSVVSPAGQMVFQFDEPARFGDVWTLAIPATRAAAPASPVRVTGAFDTLDRTFALPRQERVAWKGADGTTVEGLLFYPAGYVAGRRYPLVVQMHGGPGDSDKFGAGAGLLLSYFPVLTGHGYAVFRPNYRGSTGYGNAFYRDVVGGYFRNMQFDVMAGVDFLVKRGIADPDRLVAMGWSAGGHLTNKLVTMTTRFKAASSGAGVADWTSMYAQSDTRANRTPWFGGTPWQKNAPIAMFWNHSPLKDVANVKTPTLFFVGESDARVPLAQSIGMYRALKSNGVPTRLYVGPREGHQWVELRHRDLQGERRAGLVCPVRARRRTLRPRTGASRDAPLAARRKAGAVAQPPARLGYDQRLNPKVISAEPCFREAVEVNVNMDNEQSVRFQQSAQRQIEPRLVAESAEPEGPPPESAGSAIPWARSSTTPRSSRPSISMPCRRTSSR